MDFSRGYKDRTIPSFEPKKTEIPVLKKNYEPKQSKSAEEIDKIVEKNRIKENINLLGRKINTITGWLVKEILPLHYEKKSGDSKILNKKSPEETQSALYYGFPESTPDIKIIDILKPELAKKFDRFCSQRSRTPGLIIFEQKLEQFINEKGMGHISAQNIYDDLILLNKALENFKESISDNLTISVKKRFRLP